MRNYSRLVCPKCKEKLVRKGGSLYCANGHCYDVAASGYVNLAAGPKSSADSGDSKEMTAARHRIMSLGYYDGLLEKVCEKAAEFSPRFIADCGAGEGRFARALAEAFPEADVAGTDLAKSAVNVASRTVKNALFAVANSNALPYADGTADVAVCAFAPVFPKEISRILRAGGGFLRITPGARHLYGLKEKLYEKPYLNEESEDVPEGFTLKEVVRSEYPFTVEGQDVRALIQMTPYYYRTAAEAVDRVSAEKELATELAFRIDVFVKGQ